MRKERFGEWVRDVHEYLGEARWTPSRWALWILGLIGVAGTVFTRGTAETLLAGLASVCWGVWMGLMITEFRKWRNGL